MTQKSLLSSSLTLIFSVSAYIVYVFSIIKQDQNWIVIASLIYFLPLFVNAVEDFQNMRFQKKSNFIILLICIICGAMYLVFLLYYLAAFKDNMSVGISFFVKFMLVLLPAVCVPLKAYPFFVNIMQLYNRCVGSNS